MSGPLCELQLDTRAPCERDQGDSRESEEDTHCAKGDVGGVNGAGGEVEGSVEARDCSCESDEHLAERRVDLQVYYQSQVGETVGYGPHVEKE